MRFDLVFEGGGAKGMAFAGALQVFEDRGHAPGRLLGTSAGAIAAALVAAGYDARELLATLSAKDEQGLPAFSGFLAPPPAFSDAEIDASDVLALLRKIDNPIIPNILEHRIDRRIVEWMAGQASLRHLVALIERGGWYSPERLLAFIKRSLGTGTRRGRPREYAECTLAEFFAATEIDVSFVASDTTGGDLLVLNHRTAPGLPLAWAVFMSANIPLAWPPVEWQEAWGHYRGRDMTGHEIVDGGLLSNFPIALFASRDASVLAVMGRDPGERFIGLLLDENLPVPGAPPPPDGIASDFAGMRAAGRLTRLVNTALGGRDKLVMDELAQFVLRLPAAGYGTMEFGMTETRRDCLVRAAEDAMQGHLAQARSLAAIGFGRDEKDAARARVDADNQARRMLGLAALPDPTTD